MWVGERCHSSPPQRDKTVTQIRGLNHPSSPRVGAICWLLGGWLNSFWGPNRRATCLDRLSDNGVILTLKGDHFTINKEKKNHLLVGTK